MVLYEQGYSAISFPTEGLPSKGESKKFVEQKINELKERFEHVFLFLDSDAPGIEYSKKISKVYGLDYITTPVGGPKDISDYIKKYGRRKTRAQIKKLIKNKFNERHQGFLDLANSLSSSLRTSDVPKLPADGSSTTS